ncbi:MAG: hypothetical protein U0169_17755 [Polyangiaceae bacterium]
MKARSTFLTTAFLVGSFAGTPVQAAELREDASRVALEWTHAGATVETLPARFLNDDETLTLSLGPTPASSCVHVAFIGARGASFHVRALGIDEDESRGTSNRAASVAGVASLAICTTVEPIRIRITSDAGRGTIETVVGRSRSAVPEVAVILPDRIGTLSGNPAEPGELPLPPPVGKRADDAEGRVTWRGGAILPRLTGNASREGGGSVDLSVPPGCHSFELFGESPKARMSGRRVRLDLDAELRGEEDEVVARDRSEAPDGHLFACVGESLTGRIVFGGSVAEGPVLVTHGFWPIPENLPANWGEPARAKFASALHGRKVLPPREPPVLLAQGPAGSTPIAVPIDPGTCYVAVVAITHGASRGLGVRLHLGKEQFAEERGRANDASVVAFCARTHDKARLEVDARGTSIAWGMALFRARPDAWEGTK